MRRTNVVLSAVLVISAVVLVRALGAQQGAAAPQRLNQIIEQFEKGEPSFSGQHWQLVEMKHGAYDITQLENVVKTQTVANSRPKRTVLVRIPPEGGEVTQWFVKQALDRGVMGVIFPGVRTKEQVMKLVQYMRYPPQKGEKHPEPRGVRGWAVFAQPAMWGLPDAAAYGRKADLWPLNPEGEMLAIAMIESAEGVKNIDQIMSVPGLSGILIGPNDMSMDMGVGRGPGLSNPAAPEVEQATELIAKKCVAKKMLCGTFQAPDVKLRLDQGFRLFTGANPYANK